MQSPPRNIGPDLVQLETRHNGSRGGNLRACQWCRYFLQERKYTKVHNLDTRIDIEISEDILHTHSYSHYKLMQALSIYQLDWSEPWLYGLAVSYLILMLGLYMSRRNSAVQMFTFVFLRKYSICNYRMEPRGPGGVGSGPRSPQVV